MNPGNKYEMTNRLAGNGSRNTPAANGGMGAFWTEVTAVEELLKEYNENVSHISDLHLRSLNDLGNKQTLQQLDRVAAHNQKISNELKDRIKALQAQGGNSADGQIKRKRANLLKDRFRDALQHYQQIEQQQRNAEKSQMERQYRIVKPDASPEEIRAAVDSSEGPIFQQALLNSEQLGRSRAAYREVQDRHSDIVKLTQTIGEVQQLMEQMAMAVEEQGEVIQGIEVTTAGVEKDVENGYKQTITIRKLAKSLRKKKWMCFWIVVVILIILAGIGVLIWWKITHG